MPQRSNPLSSSLGFPTSTPTRKMTPELAAECDTAAGRADLDGFFAAPKMIFEGRWIPHWGTDYPARQARFVQGASIPCSSMAGHGQGREAPGQHVSGGCGPAISMTSLPAARPKWLEKHLAAMPRAEARTGGRIAWR